MCQNKEDAPEEIQMQNLGMTNNSSNMQSIELQPMK